MATTKELNEAYANHKTLAGQSGSSGSLPASSPPSSSGALKPEPSSSRAAIGNAETMGIPSTGPSNRVTAYVVDPGTPYYPGYEASVFKPATSQADSINEYYNQYIESQKQAEKSAYEENLRALEYEASKLSPAYKAQREALAAEREIADRNFRQSALASGINTGAGSQYALASNNAYQANMTTLRQSEAQALADVEESRRQSTAAYQNAIAKAISEGNLARAQALYQEAVRVDESIVSTAIAQAQENYNKWQADYSISRARQEDQLADYNKKLQRAETLAQYGDFSGYYDLGYSSSQVSAMKALWNRQNGGGYYGGSSGSSSSSSGSSSSSSGSVPNRVANPTPTAQSGSYYPETPIYTGANLPLSTNPVKTTINDSLATLGLTGIR